MKLRKVSLGDIEGNGGDSGFLRRHWSSEEALISRGGNDLLRRP